MQVEMGKIGFGSLILRDKNHIFNSIEDMFKNVPNIMKKKIRFDNHNHYTLSNLSIEEITRDDNFPVGLLFTVGKGKIDLTLRDSTGKIKVYAKQKLTRGYDYLKTAEVGDTVTIRGHIPYINPEQEFLVEKINVVKYNQQKTH